MTEVVHGELTLQQHTIDPRFSRDSGRSSLAFGNSEEKGSTPELRN